MKHPKRKAERVGSVARGELWAMRPPDVRQMLDIIDRITGVGPDGLAAIEARIGHPLGRSQEMKTEDGVAVVPVLGPIIPRADLLSDVSGATSLAKFSSQLADADARTDVHHIVIYVDSTGGLSGGILEAAMGVRRLATPTTAFVSGTAASAAYALAAGADRVVMGRMSLAGSVGVVATYRRNDDGDQLELVSTQSPDKRLDPATESGMAKLQALVDSMGAAFVAAIAELRGLTVGEVESWRGGVLVGCDAVAAGMADDVGSMDDIIAGLPVATEGEREDMSNAKANEKTPAAKDSADEIIASRKAGAVAEVERIRAVLDMIDPSAQERMGELAQLLWDGDTTAEMAAVRVLAAERARCGDALRQAAAETPNPLRAVESRSAAARPAPEGSDEAWDKNANNEQEEFISKADYQAYVAGSAAGRLRMANG